MIEELRSTIRSKLLPSLWSVLLALLVVFWRSVVEALPPGFLGQLKSQPLLLPLGIAVLIAIVLTFVIFLMLREDKLTPRDDVLWDRSGNAHCPACKTLVHFTQYDKTCNRTGYACIKCVRECYARGRHVDTPSAEQEDETPMERVAVAGDRAKMVPNSLIVP